MADAISSKPPRWVAGSKRDLMAMPEEVQDVFGNALYLAQAGSKHDCAKPLRGQGSAAVLGVVEDWQGTTYRAVYTVRSSAAIYVLHCFQKKAIKGIATSRPDLNLIAARLKAVEAHSRNVEP